MTQQTGELSDLAARVWDLAGGPRELIARLTVSGPRTVNCPQRST